MTLILRSLLLGLGILSSCFYNAQQYNGLTYYSVAGSTTGYLIDTNSAVVKQWFFSGPTGYSAHMAPGGFLYRSVFVPGNALTGGGMHGRVQKLNYAGIVLWDYTYTSSTYCLHHDICPMPNGNLLVISYDVKTPTDVTNAGSPSGITVWSEKVMELQPVGTNSAIVVWEWKVWDHLVQNVNSSKANYQTSIVNNPQLININYGLQKDWIHMNGIDYNPVLDQIALSSHNLNEWYIIDHSTTTAEAASHSGGNAGKGGDILYRWGNPAAYQATPAKVLFVTHDAHWIPADCPNGGNLAGLNNKGQSIPSNKSTADQAIVPRVDYNYTLTPGSPFTPSTFSARKVTTGYTTNMGSTQEFPNGNQMFCLATLGLIYEVNSANVTLWSKSAGGAVAQSKRYPYCYIQNPAPPQPSITVTGSVLSTAPANSYQWYVNGNLLTGANSQTFMPAQSGIYLVATTDSIGCMKAYSAGVTFTVSTPVLTGLNSVSMQNRINLFPNPSTGLITLEIPEEIEKFELVVTDYSGREVMKLQDSHSADLSRFAPGVYFVSVKRGQEKLFTGKVILDK